jgi:hypothetical protein
VLLCHFGTLPIAILSHGINILRGVPNLLSERYIFVMFYPSWHGSC